MAASKSNNSNATTPITVELPPGSLGDTLGALRLCPPQALQRMQLSLSKLGQLSAVQAFRVDSTVEVFDGLKRLRAARELSWQSLAVQVHTIDAASAKTRLLRCNESSGLCDLEEAWLVRSLYRHDGLKQPQIAQLLGRHKSWVCRRLAMAEDLSDELTAHVRLGLLSATTAGQLARLQRCNQDRVAQVVMRRGLTTRQVARLVDELLATPAQQWSAVLDRRCAPQPKTDRGGYPRTPGEQLVADALAMRRLAARLQTRLVERSLPSLGEVAYATATHELNELRCTLSALINTLDRRLSIPTQGAQDVATR